MGALQVLAMTLLMAGAVADTDASDTVEPESLVVVDDQASLDPPPESLLSPDDDAASEDEALTDDASAVETNDGPGEQHKPQDTAEAAASGLAPSEALLPPRTTIDWESLIQDNAARVESTRRWRTGRVFVRTGLAGMAAGPSLLIAGYALVLSNRDSVEDVGLAMLLGGVPITAYGFIAMPGGLALQSRALSDAGYQVSRRYLIVAGAGAGLCVVSGFGPLWAVGGAGMMVVGLVMQHREHRRLLDGESSGWSARVAPWSDGQQHGMRLALTW